jgi:hypothetical protein
MAGFLTPFFGAPLLFALLRRCVELAGMFLLTLFFGHLASTAPASGDTQTSHDCDCGHESHAEQSTLAPVQAHNPTHHDPDDGWQGKPSRGAVRGVAENRNAA